MPGDTSGVEDLALRVNEAFWAATDPDRPGHDPDLVLRLRRRFTRDPDLASRVLAHWLSAPPVDFQLQPWQLTRAARWFRRVLQDRPEH